MHNTQNYRLSPVRAQGRAVGFADKGTEPPVLHGMPLELR
jgi:hypothetical protein